MSIVDEPDGKPGGIACVKTSAHYDYASLEFKADRLNADRRDGFSVDVTIVHELLHVKMRDYNEAAHVVCDRLSPVEEELFHQRLEHEEEGFTQRMAEIIVMLDSQAK